MSGRRCWLLLLLATCCTGRTPQDEHNRLLRFLEPDSEQMIIDIPVIRSFSVILNHVLDRVRCVQQGLTNNECTECLSVQRMLKLTSIDESLSTTHIDDVTRLSVILVHHVSALKSTCSKRETLSCDAYDGCRDELFDRFGVDSGAISENLLLESLEEVLRNVKAVYEPLYRRKCFSAEDLLVEFNNTRFTSENESFESIMRLTIIHILRGDCIDVGDAVTDFIEYLFSEYGDKCAKVITSKGIEKMLNDLRTPPNPHNHDHHHGHSHSHSGQSSHNHNHKHHDHEHEHDHDHDDHHEHDHDHEDECHDDHDTENHESENHESVTSLNRPHKIYYYPYNSAHTDSILNENFNKNGFTGNSGNVQNSNTRKRRSVTIKRNHGDENLHEHTSLAEKCFDADMLIQRFGQSSPTNVTRNEFLQMCPALIQQIVSGVCNKNSTRTTSRPSMTELYGYSSLAVFVISLCALGGIFILPIMAKSVYHYLMMGFIGLSFGTMASDSLLHLIPQALGLHSHDAEISEVDVGVNFDNIPFYIWKQLGVLGAIYCLFVFETIMEIFSGKDDHENSQNHGHSHVPDKIPEEIRLKSVGLKTESTTNLANSQVQNVSLSMDGIASDDITPQDPVFKSKSFCCGLTSLAMVVTLGDAVHNFGDGLAIGAAFSSGLQGGLSTSLAILCHELPHEFGDFVVLISTGLSFWKALLINFISALFCFVGLYIGIQIGENEVARSWILTATAGIFLYVALVDMLPELKQSKHGSPFRMFLVKNIGVLVGIFLMLLIAIYEDHFHI